jgi:GTP-binding protein
MVRDAIQRTPPPLHQNRRPKIYYATQVSAQPPTIVLFCNNPKAITKPYQRYLLNAFRDDLSFDEVPIKLYLRKRSASDNRQDIESELIGDEASAAG